MKNKKCYRILKEIGCLSAYKKARMTSDKQTLWPNEECYNMSGLIMSTITWARSKHEALWVKLYEFFYAVELEKSLDEILNSQNVINNAAYIVKQECEQK